MNENEEYTKRQQKLLHQIQKTNRWYYNVPFIYTVYLIPVIFFVAQYIKWSLACKKLDSCLAVRLNGEAVPLDIDLLTFILWIIGAFTFLLFILSWMAVSSLQDKKTFKEILDSKDKKGP